MKRSDTIDPTGNMQWVAELVWKILLRISWNLRLRLKKVDKQVKYLENINTYVKENFETLLKSGDYEIRSPFQLNEVGYNFLFDHYIDMAIIVFEKNVNLFPDDANVHDSLGEAYMEKGDYKTSREMYTKALEIDPNFANAKTMLQRLDELEKK